MGSAAQSRAVANYRKRLNKRGMVRFEVLGLESDRDLIRSLARQLAEGSPASGRIRASISGHVGLASRKKGGILAMLQSAPAAAAGLNLSRKRVAPRKIDL
jgi:hypothetical protein